MKVRLLDSTKQDIGVFLIDGTDEQNKATPAGVVTWRGRYFVQTTLDQEDWPETITYMEQKAWAVW